MIRVAAVTNENRVVDASIAMAAGSSEGTASHQLATAPTECLSRTTRQGTKHHWNRPTGLARNQRFVVTRHEGCDGEGEDIEVCSDPGALVERYEHSQEEPVVVGGLELFEFFTLNAWRVDIVWSNEITPDQVE